MSNVSPPRARPPKPFTPPADRPARILLVRLSALGDVLHTLPAFGALRTALPDAEIHWAVGDRAQGLLQERTDIDRLLVLPRRALRKALRPVPRPWRLLPVAREFVGQLRETRYDAVVDFQGNLKSGLVTRLARSQHRLGFDARNVREGNQVFTNLRLHAANGPQHRVERNLDLASALLGRPLGYVSPGFPIPPGVEAESRTAIRAAGLEAGSYVVVHPGTSGFGSFKRWPAARYGQLIRRLGLPVAVTFGPGEEELARRVVLEAGRHATLVPTRTLGVLAGVISAARAFLGADTGPLHLASLLGTPLVGLFGPKDPSIYGPYGVDGANQPGTLRTVVNDRAACRPCKLRVCEHPICMRELPVELVEEAVGEILEAPVA